ncbi:hypothetical protein LCGC14_1980380, partial [marine sediment metagenome]
RSAYEKVKEFLDILKINAFEER